MKQGVILSEEPPIRGRAMGLGSGYGQPITDIRNML